MILVELLIFLIISTVLTYFARKIAINKAIIDIPNQRSSHTVPTPRGGGLAIVITWLIAILYLFLTQRIDPSLMFALCGALPLIIIGFLDDIYNLSPKIRIVVQILSVLIGLYFTGGLNSIDLGFYIIDRQLILLPFSFLLFVWFINLFNFLDGIDGYAGTQAIFMSIAIFLFTNSESIVFLLVAVLGFQFWNWPKAKIFMGDVGSTTLGYTLIIFGFYFNNNAEFPILFWLIISSVFWFDASITLVLRFLNKEKISEAHRKHAYQRIVQSGWSHQKTTLAALVINLIMLANVYVFYTYFHKALLFSFLISIILCSIFYRLVEKQRPFNSK